jgi:hypothetical protein
LTGLVELRDVDVGEPPMANLPGVSEIGQRANMLGVYPSPMTRLP